ncbi:MAG: DUF3791 domain-containing protein [Lachnospiraceae bacterium]|nr:DUF3791 domain-containing protein [Lachnospiraceae bacterium]
MAKKEMEFSIFCVENVAAKLNKNPQEVYRLLKEQSDIMDAYIVPCFAVLHSQSKEYIVEDIIALMKKKGVIA